MGDLGAPATDTYVMQLTFDPTGLGTVNDGTFGVAIQDASGHWVNAVTKNVGGTTAFVNGAWTAGRPLGTFGVDATGKKAWAVVNVTGGKFAAARFAP
jgi:hypothetical protein